MKHPLFVSFLFLKENFHANSRICHLLCGKVKGPMSREFSKEVLFGKAGEPIISSEFQKGITFRALHWVEINKRHYLQGLTSGRDQQKALLQGLTLGRDQQKALLQGLTLGRDQQKALLQGLTSDKDQQCRCIVTL
jgi:hypothetical protein